MADTDREQLKDKVNAGIQRNNDKGRTTIVDRVGERAIEAKDRVTDFAKEHPITTVAGAVAVGVLVAGLLRRSPSRKLSKRATKLATIGAEIAAAYATQALAAADEARKPVGDKLSDLGSTALSYGKSGSDAATKAARDAGKRIAKAIHGRLN